MLIYDSIALVSVLIPQYAISSGGRVIIRSGSSAAALGTNSDERMGSLRPFSSV